MATRKSGPGLHAHGCVKCNVRVEDACSTPKEDPECIECRGFKPWTLLIESRLWKDCCKLEARLATKEEKKRYDLAGPATRVWWICNVCKRTQVYPPKEIVERNGK